MWGAALGVFENYVSRLQWAITIDDYDSCEAKESFQMKGWWIFSVWIRGKQLKREKSTKGSYGLRFVSWMVIISFRLCFDICS